jgi:tRNA threonylcarbamoyladenosine biosynthesis protein TsaB
MIGNIHHSKGHPAKPGPYIIAVECSGRVGSVALGRGSDLLEEIVFSGKMKHSSELFPAMAGLLRSAGCTPGDIQIFCFTAGPGSFTGLRIAVTTAKMLNFAINTRLVAVNTFDVISENATEYIDKTGFNVTKIAPILDAKQNQFFTSIYKREGENWLKIKDDTLIPSTLLLDLVKDPSGSITLLGEGLLYYMNLFRSHNVNILPPEFWSAKASNVLKIGYKMAQEGKFADPQTLVPFYIRLPDAVEKCDKKEAL